MRKILPGSDQKGFTLIETMAVLVIFGVLFSVAIKKYNNITVVANFRALDAGITELNSRETLTWTNQMFATLGAIDDNAVWAAMSTNLGSDYVWTVAPTSGVGGGGTLAFSGLPVVLSRTPATGTTAANWSGP